MLEPYFFEIPIYRCDPDTHTKEMSDKEIEFTREEWKDTAPISYQNMINHFHESVWYPWKFNEVIGWLCLYIMGSQVRGEYYFDTAKRINKGIRIKKFKYVGKAFEHSLKFSLTSQEIFNEIILELEKLNFRRKPLKKRYIDLETFKTVGQFIDWKTLTEKLNSFNKKN
jgi:hypothetical protein